MQSISLVSVIHSYNSKNVQILILILNEEKLLQQNSPLIK